MNLPSPTPNRTAAGWGRMPPQADFMEGPRRNGLLAALPDSVRQRWRDYLEPVHLPRGKLLAEPGCPTSTV
jgi:hypothetical protein